MSQCPHYVSTPSPQRYHVPLGPRGIDCCLSCYVTINQPDDLSVFTTLNRDFIEQWCHDQREAERLLAEKDAVIADLRDTIEVLEAGELS